MTHNKTHGGYAAQAKRRGESYCMCNDCGRRSRTYEPEEQVTPVKIAGLVIFMLALFAAVLYGGLIVGEALR